MQLEACLARCRVSGAAIVIAEFTLRIGPIQAMIAEKLDLASAYYGLSAKDQNGFYYDGIHPNARGPEFMSNLLGDYLSG